MSKLTSDLFRKYMAGAKTLLPVEEMKITDIKNILYSFNYMAREHNVEEIDLSEVRSLKKDEAYNYAKILIGKMQESRDKSYDEAIKTVSKALLNPEVGKSKVEGISEKDINKAFIDKSSAIFEALAKKLDIRDDDGNLIYNLDLGSITQDSGGARAYIFQHSTEEYSTMTAEEIAQAVIDQFANTQETSKTQDIVEKPRPVSIKEQAKAAMNKTIYIL